MRPLLEQYVMLLVTGITNFAMFPAIINLYKQERPFETFIGMFTMVTSFLYHCCDSIDAPLWLTEGQWHRLDNVGSIMSFIIWIIYLMDLQNPLLQRYLQYSFLGMVLIMQEKSPWDDWSAITPIVLSFLFLLLSYLVNRRIPTYDLTHLRIGILFLLCGLCCFVKGLDDDHDPFRFFHGCWHGFIGISAYYNFKVLSTKETKSFLPFKVR